MNSEISTNRLDAAPLIVLRLPLENRCVRGAADQSVSEQTDRVVAKQFQSRPLNVYVEELEEHVKRKRLEAHDDDDD